MISLSWRFRFQAARDWLAFIEMMNEGAPGFHDDAEWEARLQLIRIENEV